MAADWVAETVAQRAAGTAGHWVAHLVAVKVASMAGWWVVRRVAGSAAGWVARKADYLVGRKVAK